MGLIGLPGSGSGDDDPYARVRAGESISLARLADDLGTEGLRVQLKLALPRRRTLLAIAAAPFAEEPERLMPELVAIASGRDPQLAPTAAAAAWTLCERLDPRQLADRELTPEALSQAREALASARGEPLPRADLLFALEQADAALAALQQTLGTLPPVAAKD